MICLKMSKNKKEFFTMIAIEFNPKTPISPTSPPWQHHSQISSSSSSSAMATQQNGQLIIISIISFSHSFHPNLFISHKKQKMYSSPPRSFNTPFYNTTQMPKALEKPKCLSI
ncbi:hypothetical protein Droror1_Dr00011043 [Drosera rotundifolia]